MKLIIIILFLISIIFWLIGLLSTKVRDFTLFFVKKNKSRLKLTIVYLIGLPILFIVILIILNNDKFEEFVSNKRNNITEKKQSHDSKEKELSKLSGEELFDKLITNSGLDSSSLNDAITIEKKPVDKYSISKGLGNGYKITCQNHGDFYLLKWNDKWYQAARLSWTNGTNELKPKYNTLSKEELSKILCNSINMGNFNSLLDEISI